MVKAIVAAVITIVLMAVIISLLNRDGSESEGFWKFKENDSMSILGFGVLAFVSFFVVSKIVVGSVFWGSVIAILPWIVMIIAIWGFVDGRLRTVTPRHYRNTCRYEDDFYVYEDKDDFDSDPEDYFYE